MGKGSAPPPPDYAGAAKQQGAANVAAAVAQGHINNPNVVGPYGTQTTTWNGNDPTVTQTLSPAQQGLLDQSQQTQGMLGSLAQQGATNAQGVLGQKVDYGQAPAMPGDSQALRDQVYNASMSRVNQDIGVQKDNTNSNLIAAGIRPGSQAYDNAMNLVNRQENDARQQAILNAGNQAQQAQGMDLANRNQYLQEYQQKLNTPLNQIAALLSGSQVSNPFQIPNYAQSAQVQAAPIFAATNAAGQYNTDVYNAKQAAQGGLTSGLFGLGGSGLMAGAMLA